MSADRAQNSRNANTVPAWVNDQAQLLLQLQWSPEQIASKLPISHETVYLRVYADKAQGGTLWKTMLRDTKLVELMDSIFTMDLADNLVALMVNAFTAPQVLKWVELTARGFMTLPVVK